MLTPIEKAKEIIEKFEALGLSRFVAKQCAIIEVMEILDVLHFNSSHIAPYFHQVKEEVHMYKN